MTRILLYRRRLMFLLLLTLLASCGGLAGEPQIVATLPPQTPRPQDVGYPLAAPDLALGAQIFQARCTRCHGSGGQGDGEFVLSGQITRPRDFTDPATAGGQNPSAWFATITNGRLETRMPPWADELSEQERWAVALYTYTLAYSQDQLERGEQVWQANCVECHGETGRGDGPKAAELPSPVGDLTQQPEVVGLSDDDLYTIVTEGVGDMQGLAETLDEESRRAVVAYARTLALANPGVIGREVEPAATPEVQQAAAVPGTVTGRVVNGTVASTVPADLTVTLMIHSGGEIEERDAAINPDGTFTFTDVPIDAETSYFAAATYRDRRFFSGLEQGDPANPAIDLPLTIYELTEDPAVVTVNRMAMLIQPSQNEVAGDGLEIRQLIVYRNESDRVFTTSREVGEQTYATLLVPLPPGAVILGMDNPQRYILAEDQFALIDTAPVMPGDDHVVEVTYFIPYTDGAIIEQPLNNDFEGDIRLLVWPESLNVTSQQITQTSELESEGHVFRVFDGALSLSRGEVVRYELSGRAFTETAPASSIVTGNNLLPIVLIVLGAGLLVFGGALYTRERRRSGEDKSRIIDLLVRQIAELDEAHERGQINHDYYHRQRQQLKARLAELMGASSEK